MMMSGLQIDRASTYSENKKQKPTKNMQKCTPTSETFEVKNTADLEMITSHEYDFVINLFIKNNSFLTITVSEAYTEFL
jgi:hypothetical protein